MTFSELADQIVTMAKKASEEAERLKEASDALQSARDSLESVDSEAIDKLTE